MLQNTSRRPTLQVREPTSQQVNRNLLFPFYYAPGRRMVHVVALISDEPGTLSSLLSALKVQVNLISTSSYSLGGNSAIFSGFGEALSQSVSEQTLQEMITELPNVNGTQVWESKDGLIVDRYHTGFQAGAGEPYLILPAKALSETFEEIVRTFDSGGRMILYDQGLGYGRSRSGVYKKIIGAHPEKRLDELTAIVGALGFGKSVATLSSSRSALTLTSVECFECSTRTKTGRGCDFLRGMAVGIFSALFDKELIGEETVCRQTGGKQCEFVLKTKDQLPLF
jgi:predicted hydrocarbon binding protein